MGQPSTRPSDLLSWMNGIDQLAIAVNRRHDLAEVLEQIARTASELLGYQSSAVFLADDDRAALQIKGSWGLTESYVRLVNVEVPVLLAPADESAGSPSRRAFVNGVPVTVADIARDPSYGPWARAAQDHGHLALASVPLRQAGDIVGTLNVYADEPRQLGPGGLELLQVLASHAGIALETRAQLERDLRRVQELCVLNETLRDRTRLLQQHAEIHDRFIGVARRGGGTAEIAAELAAATGRAVLVQDVSGQVLASAAHAGVSVIPPEWSRQDEDGRSVPDLLSPAAPVAVSPLFPGLLAGPVKVGDELLGVLWLAGESQTDDLHLRAIEQAAVVLGLELLRLRATADAQWQLRGDLVSELISGPQTDAVALFARADRLGGDLRPPQRVIAVRQAATGDAVPPRLLQLVQSVVLAQPRAKPLLTSRGDTVLVVVPEPLTGTGEAFAARIKITSRQALGLEVRVAVGEPSPDLAHVPAASRQALGLLRLVPYAPGEAVLTVAAAGMVGMLLADVDPRRMAPLAERWIGPLRDYDQRKNTELVATLRAYLNSDLDRNSAGAALYVHPNTIGLRLKRIEALLDVSLTSVDHLTTLRTALEIDDITRGGLACTR
jgi:sugar diacid utilization regulator